MKIKHPESIEEAIDDLETFFDVDLYSKFRPEMKLPLGKKGKIEKWYRQDFFKNENQFRKYLEAHFNILRKAIKRLKRKK